MIKSFFFICNTAISLLSPAVTFYIFEYKCLVNQFHINIMNKTLKLTYGCPGPVKTVAYHV